MYTTQKGMIQEIRSNLAQKWNSMIYPKIGYVHPAVQGKMHFINWSEAT